MKLIRDAELVAKEIERKVLDVLSKNDYAVIAFPGGRSVKLIFEPLKNSSIPWKDVHIFMVDERLVPINDDESNFRLVKENLLDSLVEMKMLPEENIHPFVMKSPPGYGIGEYEEELKKFGGSFDIVILGIGEDGHIAALYPNHSVMNQAAYFFVLHDSPKPPKDRMTASKKLIKSAKLGVFLFVGEGKREAFEKFNSKAATINDCPAKIAYEMESIVFTKL